MKKFRYKSLKNGLNVSSTVFDFIEQNKSFQILEIFWLDLSIKITIGLQQFREVWELLEWSECAGSKRAFRREVLSEALESFLNDLKF